MIAACGQWYSMTYRNACLACERSGRIKERTCRCCRGSGWHTTAHPTGTHPFPTMWQRR